MSSPSVRRVLLAGGTHGNEQVGVWLAKTWLARPDLVRRESFETQVLLANPRAVQAGVRYVDQDLNRSFSAPSGDPRAPYEAQRAQEILARFGPSGSEPADLVIDLHTTTANMGLSLILTNRDPFNLRMAQWLSEREPRLKVYLWIDATLPKSALSGQTTRGATIEVGPTPNNVLRADLCVATEQLVQLCLDFVEEFNGGAFESSAPRELEVFEHLESCDYPRDAAGAVVAMVHPELQDADYTALEPGEPIFLTRDGETLVYGGGGTVYPVFVNEAAYYEKGIAFSLARRELLWV